MMNYYFDDSKTLRPFTIALEANENSLTPNNALRTQPEFKNGYYPCEKNGQWIQEEDHRGKKVYSTLTQEQITICELGNIPDGYTENVPNTQFDTWSDGEWIEDSVLKIEYAHLINYSKVNELTKEANERIAILQDTIDFDMQESNEEEQLKTWKKYRILLSRVDLTVEYVEWPEKPE